MNESIYDWIKNMRGSLRVISGYFGEKVRVTLYPDSKRDSGILFYGVSHVEEAKVDQVADEIRYAVREALKRGIPVGLPVIGGRPVEE